MNRFRKLKIGLYLAGIFFAGIVTGVFISYQVVRHMMPSQERMANHWCGELQSKLNLTPEQLRKIRPLVDGALTDFKSGLSQQMLLSLSNCNLRIAAELTAEQKPKFEQIEREQREFILTKLGGAPSSPREKP